MAYDPGIDLDRFGFDEFVRFVFDHPAPPMPRTDAEKEAEFDESEKREPAWYHRREWRHHGTPEVLLPYLIRLYRDPAWLMDAYSEDQLYQGFWYLGGEYDRWLWDEEVDRNLRREYALSMVPLEEKLFAVNPLFTTCYMWFDFFRTFEAQPDPDTADYLLEALTQVLYLPSEECRMSALHGLGHLEHPRKAEVLEKYLADHPETDDELRSYIREAVLTGEIL